MSQLGRWDEALDTLVIQRQSQSLQQSDGSKGHLAMLKVQGGCYSILTTTFCHITDAKFAKINTEFRMAVGRIGSVLSHQSTKTKLRSFSCDTSLVLTLFFVVLKTWDPEIREKAVRLLEGITRREGLWDAMMAEIVRRIMMLKEEGRRKKEGVSQLTSTGLQLSIWCRALLVNGLAFMVWQKL